MFTLGYDTRTVDRVNARELLPPVSATVMGRQRN